MRKNYYINWFPSRNSNYSLQFAYFSLDYIKEKKEVKVESKLQIISPLVNFIFLLKSLKNFSSSLDIVSATISVLPRLQVSTIQLFGATSRDPHEEGAIRESSFVLLQFVTALKSLQARGIEESARSLNNVVLCREDKDAYYRLYLLQGCVNARTKLARNWFAHCSITSQQIERGDERGQGGGEGFVVPMRPRRSSTAQLG